jgi:hypothetical protein
MYFIYDLFSTHVFYLCIGVGVVYQKYEHFVDKSTQKYTVQQTVLILSKYGATKSERNPQVSSL